MSRQVCVQFEVRDQLIMKDTLKTMGYNYQDLGTSLSIQKPYHNIVINTETGEISYDNAQEREVNGIKRNYMVNFYRDKAIKEGMQLQQEVLADGTITLRVTHS